MTLVLVFVVVGAIILATVKLKLHPVFSLTTAAVVSGLILGMEVKGLMSTIAEGFGKTLSSIGLVIAFGTVIGASLERTGGTKVIANKLLNAIGLKRSPLALNLAGFVVSIPVYCDSGFVILSSLNKALSKKSGIPYLVFALALATGLYAAHVFVPPTPGPLAAAAIVGADLGLLLILGLLVAIIVSLAGYFWSVFMGRKLEVSEDSIPNIDHEDLDETIEEPSISFFWAIIPLMIPLVFIGLKSVAEYPTHPLGEGVALEILTFIGDPIIALLIGAFMAFVLSWKYAKPADDGWVGKAMKDAGAIILITGAGGAFGAILREADIASNMNLESVSGSLGLIALFGISALLKSAQGSSTVAIITVAAIAAPILEPLGLTGQVAKVLAVMSIGAGAMTVSHVNDSYFWVVSQISKMELKTALKGHTLATLVQGVTGLVVILIIYAIGLR